MAPETIEMQPPCAASDIWSVGATIIEMLTARPPYFELSPISAIFRIVQDAQPPVPEKLSDKMRDLITQCFIRDTEARPKASDLLKHPVFESSELNNPSYERLKDTLRTLHRTKKGMKFRSNLTDWNFASPSSPESGKRGASSPSPDAVKRGESPRSHSHPSLFRQSGGEDHGDSPRSPLYRSADENNHTPRGDKDETGITPRESQPETPRTPEETIQALREELRKEKEANHQREATIHQLQIENSELHKKVGILTNKNPEDFYRDYFITMAMSVKMALISQHKDFRININALLEAAQKEKVPIHELVDWIPNTLKKKHKAQFKV